MTEKVADGTRGKTKNEFNIEYGKWLRDVRMEFALTPENVEAMADVPVEVLQALENGESLEFYYLLRLWELYDIK